MKIITIYNMQDARSNISNMDEAYRWRALIHKGIIPYVWEVIGAIPWHVVIPKKKRFGQGMKLQQQQGRHMSMLP